MHPFKFQKKHKNTLFLLSKNIILSIIIQTCVNHIIMEMRMPYNPVPSDIEIAQNARILPITDLADSVGILTSELYPYGKNKAKVDLSLLDRLQDKPDGKFIVVTGITPTPLGEGKTVTAIGLGQGLAKIGKRVFNTMREPSKGPTFGIKGGGTGGGYSQVIPMEEINLHFTGDIHAVETAHNLASAVLDNSLLKDNPLRIDPFNIVARRCMDLNDRTLRNIVIGLGGKVNGVVRESGFDITVATETMAILALADSMKNLRTRLGRMILAYDIEGRPVTAEDLKVAGSMTALLKDAIMPNLVQTLEHTPVFIHCGPFANVAHGNNSVLADRMAVKLADYVVTEAGFGSDCGFEKAVNIKSRQSGIKIDCAVIVASIRAIKMHGGAYTIIPGRKLDNDVMNREDLSAVERGCMNLARHIANVRQHGVPAIVAINRFTTDTDAEIALVEKLALQAGAQAVVTSEAWSRGGDGCTDLARAVVRACEAPSEMKFLYPLEASIKEKIETIATKIYGASGVDYEPLAEKKIKTYTDLGFGQLPICMAKTPLSLSDDPTLKGAPTNFRVTIRDIRASIGAGFLYPLLGNIMTMPGLPSEGAFTLIDIDENGRIIGLS
jgi:formate--tetrahydrofolate ligase